MTEQSLTYWLCTINIIKTNKCYICNIMDLDSFTERGVLMKNSMAQPSDKKYISCSIDVLIHVCFNCNS